MAEDFSTRRGKLNTALALVYGLINLNDQAEETDRVMKEGNVLQSDREDTLTGLFDGAGPPKITGDANLPECAGSTISDRIVNILNGALVDGVDWDPTVST